MKKRFAVKVFWNYGSNSYAQRVKEGWTVQVYPTYYSLRNAEELRGIIEVCQHEGNANDVQTVMLEKHEFRD